MNKRLMELIYKTHKILQNIESTPRDYGTGDLLYSADIHTVTAVAKNPGCNLTQLAESLIVSKPAAFKFVKKMVSLDYLYKEKSSDNKKEINIMLTSKGKTAIEKHIAYESELFDKIYKITNELPPEEFQIIEKYMLKLINSMEEN